MSAVTHKFSYFNFSSKMYFSFLFCIHPAAFSCLLWLYTSASWKAPSPALTQMVAHSLHSSLLFFPLSSCLTLSLRLSSYSLSSLSQSLSSLDHFGPLLLSLSLTPTQLCHTLIPALPGHHLHYRGSSLYLRFARWTHSPQSPFPPRRVPRWQRSPFPG